MDRRNFLGGLLASGATILAGAVKTHVEPVREELPLKVMLDALPLDYDSYLSLDEMMKHVTIDHTSKTIDINRTITGKQLFAVENRLRNRYEELRRYGRTLTDIFIHNGDLALNSSAGYKFTDRTMKNIREASLSVHAGDFKETKRYVSFKIVGTEGVWYFNDKVYIPCSLILVDDLDTLKIKLYEGQKEFAGIEDVKMVIGREEFTCHSISPSRIEKRVKT